MSSSILRRISHKGAAEASLFRWISRTGAATNEIFRSPNCCGSRLGVRMISTVNSDESLSSSTLPSRILPWLMLPPAFEGGDMVYKFYSVAENKVVSLNKRGKQDSSPESPDDDAKFVGSSHGWLVLFNERNCDLFLSNPYSRRHIKLPPIHTLPIPKENLGGGFGCVDKVIIARHSEDSECRAMMSFGPESRLAFCWSRHSTEWTPIGALFEEDEEGKWARHYEDFVYSNTRKLFFCITQYSVLEAWDLHDPRSPRMIDQIHINDEEENEECIQLKYLVFAEQSNQLFLVTRHIVERMAPDGSHVQSMYMDWDYSYPYKTVGFDVHKNIDGEDNRKVVSYMEGTLDGLVMFVGINHSFAMSAEEFPELKPNSIYFTDDKELTPPRWVDRKYGGHDIGIFDYENRTFSPCYYPCDVQSIKRIVPAPMWFTPSLREFY